MIVTLAILAAVGLGGTVPVVIQAASTAVLMVTLTRQGRDIEQTRFVDALIGGAVALLVTSVLLPLNPLRLINRSAGPAFDAVSRAARRRREGAAAPGCRRPRTGP